MPRNMLVAYSMSSTYVQTTLDYIMAFKHYSGYETKYLHVTHDAHVGIDFDAEGYDVIVHNYCSRFCFDGYVSETYRSALRRFSGLKVLAIQDEYDHTNKLKNAIKEHGFQIVLTCVPQDFLPFVYPSNEFPDVEFVTVFTGYVPEGFASEHRSSLRLSERPTVIGYRGRDIGSRYGRLGFEKFEIGRRMKEICDAQGVVNDIAMTESSRIYGKAWFDFVGNCRAMLGSESGSNVFDFDGAIQKEHARLAKKLGRPPSYAEFSTIIAEREKQIDMGQISPRVFECAVMRTPMVLFRGRYSGAIQADTHYIPLELDFSNASAILERLQDIPALEAMAERAYQHLVASEQFGYRAYVEMLVERFELRLERIVKVKPPAASIDTTVISRRQTTLTERPTELPKGAVDFKKLQLRLAGLGYADQAGQLDAIFHRATSLLEHETTELLAAYKRIAGPLEVSPASHLATFKLQYSEKLAQAEALRADYHAKRNKLVLGLASSRQSNNFATIGDIESELAVLDQDWIATYSDAYTSFREARNAFIKTIDAQARKTFRSAPKSRALYWITRARLRAYGSKLEIAKAILNRVPGGRAIAMAALKLAHKRG